MTSVNNLKVSFTVVREDFSVAGEASSQIKKTLSQLGIPPSIIRKVAIIAYEAEMNIVIHSWGGELILEVNPQWIKITAQDTGPGIPDIGLAMQEGFSTASDHIRELGFGAGMGLPNMKANADMFCINSQLNKGTTVEITCNY